MLNYSTFIYNYKIKRLQYFGLFISGFMHIIPKNIYNPQNLMTFAVERKNEKLK